MLPGLPSGQCNAWLDEGLVMRAGLPHRSGRLAFHAFNQDYPVMVSANAFWDAARGHFHVPKASDLYELDFALDSAGYSAMSQWKRKGRQDGMAGIFPWTYGQYIELASELSPAWWSQPDLCCEPEIAGSPAEVDFRVRATATLLEGVLRVVYAWQNELAKSCDASTVANMLRPPVPVLQGWNADDYLRSLDLLMSVWTRWEPWLAPPVLIGIGSVCRRDLHDRKHGLYAILSALEGRLPAGAKVHLFGVKGACLATLKMHDWIGSADSMAYDFSSRLKSHKEGYSNSIERRSAEMTRWMNSALDKVRPARGDQYLLPMHR
jgi:hypothetical protein